MALFHFIMVSLFYTAATELVSTQGIIRRVSPCICAGEEVTYECTIAGEGGTFWQGTSLSECTNGQITIRHSAHSTKNNISETCDNVGWIFVYPVSAINNSYTSHLIIRNITQNLNGSTIECTSDSGEQTGQIVITFSTATLPTVNRIFVSEVAQGQISFEWNPIQTNCPAISYEITTTNCGHCSANVTDTPNITCNVSSTRRPTCELNVTTKSNICGNALEVFSSLSIHLKEVVDIRFAEVIPSSNFFPLIRTVFQRTGALNNMSQDINVHTTSYTIVYSDANSGIICDIVSIPVTLCYANNCNIIQEVTSQACQNSSWLNVAVFAVSLLGDGPLSDTFTVKNSATIHAQKSFEPSLIVSVGLAILLLISVIVVAICGAIIVTLFKKKQKLQSDLNERLNNETKIYEEISLQRPPSDYSTEENSAYGVAKT